LLDEKTLRTNQVKHLQHQRRPQQILQSDRRRPTLRTAYRSRHPKTSTPHRSACESHAAVVPRH
jgi:hypothetical protein